jgi:hypothetical protein
MFRLAPIDNDFVPYSRRPVRKNNARLFVTRGRRSRRAGVALQSSVFRPPDCSYEGQCCGPYLICSNGPGGLNCAPDPTGKCSP